MQPNNKHINGLTATAKYHRSPHISILSPVCLPLPSTHLLAKKMNDKDSHCSLPRGVPLFHSPFRFSRPPVDLSIQTALAKPTCIPVNYRNSKKIMWTCREANNGFQHSGELRRALFFRPVSLPPCFFPKPETPDAKPGTSWGHSFCHQDGCFNKGGLIVLAGSQDRKGGFS